MRSRLVSATEPSVAIIVLNWNNASDTIACLGSLRHIEYANCTVVVVDNGSTDESVTRIRAQFPKIEILQTGANLGYAGGNNVGIRHALEQDADYVCILNNDITVEPDFLTRLPSVFQTYSYSDAGVVTPLVGEMPDRGRVWALGSAVNWRTGAVTRLHAGEPVRALRNHDPLEVDIASGAAMLVKREVLERVGLLDEAFFLYFEETDWCLRIRQAGYCILAVPSSVVWHKVSATLGTTSPVIDYYMLRNHLRLIARHWPGARRLYLLGRIVLRNLLTIATYTVKSHNGRRISNRDARLLALRDATLGRWGKMGPDVAKVCYPNGQ